MGDATGGGDGTCVGGGLGKKFAYLANAESIAARHTLLFNVALLAASGVSLCRPLGSLTTTMQISRREKLADE